MVYLESIRDARLTQLPVTNFPITDSEVAVPHELGHQFGLNGDQSGSVFGIMDYPVGMSLPSRVAFNNEHINLMRRRIKSPGN